MYIFKLPFLTTVMSDISNFRPVRVSTDTDNEALNIQVIPQSDTISLELEDRIILRFNFSTPMVTPDTYFGETGEFIRNVTSVRIIDDDSKCCVLYIIAKSW